MRRDGGSRLISFKKTSLITLVVFLLVIAFCGCKNNKGLPDKIYYIDTLSNAAFKGLSYGDAITLKTIQGIVNRDKPRFYIISGSFAFSDTDREWVKYYKEHLKTEFVELKNIEEVLTTFKDFFKGIIVFDDSIKSYNNWISPLADTAAVIAGLTDTLPVKEMLVPRYTQITGLEVLDTVTIKSNGRTKTITGDLTKLKFSNGLEIYHWMVDNLIEFVNQHEYLQLNWEGMDFAVQNKMLFIDVNIVSDIPSRELEDKVHEYFASKNELFDVWGWVEDEYIGVDRISKAGGFLRNIASGNLSFHSVVPSTIKEFKQKSSKSLDSFVVDKNKFYIIFMASEADTAKAPISFNHGGYLDESRGAVAINWGMPANTIIDFPAVAEYYQNTATENDYFYTSGGHYGGYVNVCSLPEKSLNRMIQDGKELAKISDQPYLDYFSTFVFGTPQISKLSEYAKKLRVKGLIGRHKNSITKVEDWDGVLAVDRYYSYPERMIVYDHPTIISGGFSKHKGTDKENYMIYDSEYEYMALDARFKSGATAKGILAIRGFISQDNKSYYELRLVDGIRLQVVKVINGEETILHSERQIISTNSDYTMRLYLDGKTVAAAFGGKGYSDRRYICKVEDSELTKGRYGLYTTNDTEIRLRCVPREPWREIYNNILKETIKTRKGGGVCAGYYGVIVKDYETSQFKIENVYDEWLVVTPTDLKKVMDELEKNYPGKFEAVTLDKFMKAAEAFK